MAGPICPLMAGVRGSSLLTLGAESCSLPGSHSTPEVNPCCLWAHGGIALCWGVGLSCCKPQVLQASGLAKGINLFQSRPGLQMQDTHVQGRFDPKGPTTRSSLGLQGCADTWDRQAGHRFTWRTQGPDRDPKGGSLTPHRNIQESCHNLQAT